MTVTMTAGDQADIHDAKVVERLASTVGEHFFEQIREFPHDRTGVRQLRFVGRYMNRMTSDPEFHDRPLSDAMSAKCDAMDLEWKALTEPMTDAETDAVLANAGLV